MDMRGQVAARSESEFWPSPAGVVLSPDLEQFAIVTVPRGVSPGTGVYIGGFAGAQPRRIVGISPPTTSNVPFLTHTMVDWSQSGQTLLLSHQGTISVLDLSGTSRKIADGSSALWSPSGEWISYVTPQSEHAILNVATGVRTLIDGGNQSGSPLEWSPDGKYLLVPEGGDWFGHLWVYRVADRAWYPIPDHYGMAGPGPRWVELVN
jgi:hypothetical protein